MPVKMLQLAHGQPHCSISNGPSRAGEILHSLAAIAQARELLDYAPEVALSEGLAQTVAWYRGG